MRPLVLDTDIGTDVDDLLALLLILVEPDIDLVGVTTVHGDTGLRAAIAQTVLRRLGRRTIPVFAGEPATLSGTPVDWKGHEGQGFGDLPRYRSPGINAAEFIGHAAERACDQLEILAIAPLTNVAIALRQTPGIAARLKHLYLMGGAFWPPWLEHNFVTDPQATREVLAAGIPTTIIGLDVTLKIVFSRFDADFVTAAPTALARLVRDQSERWFTFLNRDFCHLHDPLAALAVTRPDLFRFRRGEVALDEQLQARIRETSVFDTRVAVHVEAHAARELIFSHLRTILREAP